MLPALVFGRVLFRAPQRRGDAASALRDPPVEFPYDDDLQGTASLHDARRNAHRADRREAADLGVPPADRKSTRLNSSHGYISYAVFCLKKKKNTPGTSAAPARCQPGA